MEVKLNKMTILATVKLNRKNEDVIMEGGDIAFLTSHDENILIDYAYLNKKVLLLEEKIHDKLMFRDKELINVSLIVKEWKIGTNIYTVKNHHRKELKRTITNSN